MSKVSWVSLLIACLPGASFGVNGYDYVKTAVNKAIKENAFEHASGVRTGSFSDRCQNNGAHYNDYTIDRRCYLTDEQKQKSPYNAVVALYDKGGNYCTGTIVKNPNDGKLYVYTARHCVDDNGTDPISVRLQDGTEMQVEFMYSGMGKQGNDSAMYKIPDEYTESVPFVTTGDMYSGYFEVVGYGALPIMSDKQILAARDEFKKALSNKKINKDNFIKEIGETKLFTKIFPNDSEQLKGSFHCHLSDFESSGDKASVDKTSCQSWGGNSGGPIFDENGLLIAIHTQGRAREFIAYYDNLYAETFLGGQEEVSDVQDEIINSNSKVRDKAGRCFTAFQNKNNSYTLSNSNLCKDVPFGGWSITLGNGATYTGFAKCMATESVLNNNDFNRSGTGKYCWCKTAGANANWEYSYQAYKDADGCETWCEEDCAKDFTEKEEFLTSNQPKTPNANFRTYKGSCFAKVDLQGNGNYRFGNVDSSQCSDIPYGGWAVIYADGTKYHGMAKCTSLDTIQVNAELNRSITTTGEQCWCKFDGANTDWIKTYVFDDSSECEDTCGQACIEKGI